MLIPNRLRNMKFCKVLYKTKKPIEADWPDKFYTYDQISIWVKENKNYGVLTGLPIDDNPDLRLGVLDDDTPDKKLMLLFESLYGLSFRVRNHYYILLRGWNGKKIIFYDDDGFHCGELQGLGQMVVGAGSIHPSGQSYDVKEDINLLEIDYTDFVKSFGAYIPKEKDPVTKQENKTKWTGANITQIPISNVISFSELKYMGNGCYQGPHPQHSSTTGMNFRVDTNKNVWRCFRCKSGGSSSELIGVMEGIISCGDAGKSCYSQELGQRVIQVAREKYGLKAPKKDLGKVRGYANSVSIIKMAKHHNIENCPKCNAPFKFEDSHGLFFCKVCKYGGGLNQFAKLILEVEDGSRN